MSGRSSSQRCRACRPSMAVRTLYLPAEGVGHQVEEIGVVVDDQHFHYGFSCGAWGALPDARLARAGPAAESASPVRQRAHCLDYRCRGLYDGAGPG